MNTDGSQVVSDPLEVKIMVATSAYASFVSALS